MKKLLGLATAVLLLAAACRSGQEQPVAHKSATADPHSQPAASSTAPLNPVQHEMQLLTAALQAAVHGIGTGEVSEVEHQLHRVHEAKQATATALGDGSYRPPKNSEQLDRFRALDEAFHDKLTGLVQASRSNDVSATARAVGEVLQSCQGCHSEFRQ